MARLHLVFSDDLSEVLAVEIAAETLEAQQELERRAALIMELFNNKQERTAA